MPKCALPDHLKEKLHSDWIWPLSKIPRAANAKGPRCGIGNNGYLPWPPKLIEGLGVTRWESNESTSIIQIPDFLGYIKSDDIYGKTFDVIERKEGHADYGKVFKVTLKWTEVTYNGSTFSPQQYHPSAIQSFSNKGFMKCDPYYYSSWRNKVYFFRYGWRPDSLDVYYNWGPYLGINYE